MNLSRISIAIYNWIQKRRYYYIVFFVIAALLVIEITRLFLLPGIENRWETIQEEQAHREAHIIQSEFDQIQERVFTISETISQQLTGISGKAKAKICFTVLQTMDLDELQGVEIFTPDRNVIAWWGRVPDEVILEGPFTAQDGVRSIITQGTVFTTLTIVQPILDYDGSTIGYIAVHEAFDVQYVLSPRFIRMQGLHRDLREKLGKPVQLVFDRDVLLEGELQVPLRGLDDALLGFAIIAPPTLEGYIANVENTFQQVRGFLIIILSIFIIVGIIRWLRRLKFPLYALILSLVVVWGIRYLWMLLDIPRALIGGNAFDPAYYASPHGGGIVASAGDLLITALFLIFTGLLLFHSIVVNNGLQIPQRVKENRWLLPSLGALVVMVLFMGLTRSYAASVRSLVFDSSIRFTDPGSLLPSPMLALMQLNLLTLTAAFVLLGTVLGYVALRLIQAGLHRSLLISSIVLLIIIFATATGFYLPQDTPLVPLWYYAGVPIVLIGITLLVQRGFLQSFRLYKIRSILFLTGISVLFATPVLDRKIHEFDREQIQFIADNIIRPTDAWKDFVLHQSLREFSNDQDLIYLLDEKDYDALEKKAFHLWANSMIGREGYNTTLLILDRDDNVVSRFSIGFQTSDEVIIKNMYQEDEIEYTIIHDIETIYGNATLYAAQSGIYAETGERIGTVVVNLITGPGTLFRGYGPDILHTHVSPDIAARYGQLIVSEFEGAQLVSTTATNIPSTHTLPDKIAESLEQDDASFIWHREYIEGDLYETAYFRDPEGGPHSYVAISIPYLDFRWHIFYALKLIFFALTVSGIILLVAGVVFYIQGKRYQPTFREKILIGLLSLSLIPIIIIAYLNRDFTIERMTEDTSRQLLDDAKRVALQVERLPETDDIQGTLEISQIMAERIAAELGIDFVIYIDAYMSSTSRMEMFEAELMDKRLSGYAYSNIVLQGKNFITREEAIGQSSYLVGYRPLFDDNNRLFGVLAVPAIYRQAEIDEEIARRDAFLFGIYAIVMLGVIVTGLIVANRFSRPIEKLTEATHEVADGRLDIHLDAKGDSEISNLMRSFNVMAQRLAESRNELARVERELAWREMARQVAHEIKNPLTPMKLSIQQLRQARKDQSKDFDRSFDIITRMMLDQIETLDKIASEFSHFARMPAPNYQTVNVNSVLRRVLAIFPDKNGIDFKTNFDDTIPDIIADPEELQRAFINIIRNGIQAMPDGGEIEITTEQRKNTIIITISDSGTGFLPEARARLFEPNFSTKTDGMGLGLALVKKTIDELNGTVNISSEEHVGTTVSITLPVKSKHDGNSGKESS